MYVDLGGTVGGVSVDVVIVAAFICGLGTCSDRSKYYEHEAIGIIRLHNTICY